MCQTCAFFLHVTDLYVQCTAPLVPLMFYGGRAQLSSGENTRVSPLYQNKSQSIVNLSVSALLFRRLPISSHPRNIGMWDLDQLCPKHWGKQASFLFFLFFSFLFSFLCGWQSQWQSTRLVPVQPYRGRGGGHLTYMGLSSGWPKILTAGMLHLAPSSPEPGPD